MSILKWYDSLCVLETKYKKVSVLIIVWHIIATETSTESCLKLKI